MAESFDFSVGDSFTSFDELQLKIRQFETESCTQLWKREARLLAKAKTMRPLSAK